MTITLTPRQRMLLVELMNEREDSFADIGEENLDDSDREDQVIIYEICALFDAAEEKEPTNDAD